VEGSVGARLDVALSESRIAPDRSDVRNLAGEARPRVVASFELKATFGTVSTSLAAFTVIFTFAVIPGFRSIPGFATRTIAV